LLIPNFGESWKGEGYDCEGEKNEEVNNEN
jgi:hypothetical protein